MKSISPLNAIRVSAVASAVAMALASAGVANATLITQNFGTGDEGGIVTFIDAQEGGSGLAANQLKITFDNTTNGPTFSTAITGLVFNVDQHIDTVSSWTLVDGNNVDISSYWSVNIDAGGSISNNTVFDIYFASGNINGGIYNAADPGSNISGNVFPDIATLILTISNPNPYDLISVGDDSILRMQRAGLDGEGSLKLVTTSSSSSTSGQASSSTTSGQTSSSTTSGQTSSGNIPEPGMLSLLGIGLLGQALILRQRRRRLQQQ